MFIRQASQKKGLPSAKTRSFNCPIIKGLSLDRELLSASGISIITIAAMTRILVDPDSCNGQAIIKGTGITLRTGLEFLAVGDSIEYVLEEYPRFRMRTY